MKIGILGGGIAGLVASYFLSKENCEVFVFEKESKCGGMASGFKIPSWQWYLDRSYHHLFSNDCEIINFAKEIGFRRIVFKKPETASLFQIDSNLQIFPLDTPQQLFRFPLLSWSEKIRTATVLGFLKIVPFLRVFESITATDFLEYTLGKKSFEIIFKELFRKKFGKYAGNVLASFIWARIKKRSKILGYFEGGFQSFIDYLVLKCQELGVKIYTNSKIEKIKRKNNGFLLTINTIKEEFFDIIISTLPTPILLRIGSEIFPKDFVISLSKIRYLHGQNLILELKRPFLQTTYWLNISVPEIPIMGVVEHTNFIDKKYYANNHIVYLGWYLDNKDWLWNATKEQILEFVFPHITRINKNLSKKHLVNSFLLRASFAQPIFDSNFLLNKPSMNTPINNFFIGNLDLTYPFDRGTNYAVAVGKQIVKKVISSGKLR